MFPTGGDQGTKLFRFRHGFDWVLERLNTDDMIYSFFINPRHVRPFAGFNLEKVLRFSGFGLDLLLSSRLNINRCKKGIAIQVRENYSVAQEWQAAIASDSGKYRRDMATRHYLLKFGLHSIRDHYSGCGTSPVSLRRT